MVRLVFRPYAQFWQSICTSELLRSSIRVSPDFNLIRHSSPSFGSHFMRSWYILLTIVVKRSKTNGYPGMEKFSINTEFVIPKQNSYVNSASEVYKSHWLAHKIDFLVRVSRRVMKITKQIHCWSRHNTINHYWLHHKGVILWSHLNPSDIYTRHQQFTLLSCISP